MMQHGYHYMPVGDKHYYINMLGANCNREPRIGSREPETSPLILIMKYIFDVSKM